VEPLIPAKQTRFNRLRLFHVLAIGATSAITFFFGLGWLALIGPDEPRYAEVAREMFVSGDYISTRLCGCLWFEKPALLYWLSAASYAVAGVGEFAARLPSALAALASVIMVYRMVYRLTAANSASTAFVAAMVLATSGLFVAYARVVTPDMVLAASMTLALGAAYRAMEREADRARFAHWVLFGIGLGLAVLAKGLVGIVLSPAIVVSYSLLARRRRWINWRELASSAIAFILVASTWYAPVIARHGAEFIGEFFERHHFHRFASNVYGHPQPFYFFLVIAIIGVAPWSAVLISAAARRSGSAKGGPEQGGEESLRRFAWLWTLIPVLFFSFSGSKLPGYILMVMPALAIIVAIETGRLKEQPSARRWVVDVGTLVCTGALTAILPVLSWRELGSLAGWKLILVLLPLLFVAAAGCFLIARRRSWFHFALTGGLLSGVVIAVLVLFAPLDHHFSLKPLSVEAAANLRPNERICYYIKKEFGAVFYAQGRVVCDVGEMDILNALHGDVLADALGRERARGSESLIVITLSNWRVGLETDPRFETELLARQGEALAFRISLRD
jgi:4-amino-4-deoxy-L-arabinose transferase-like glycosyltransferase